jgi:hypothetical protein
MENKKQQPIDVPVRHGLREYCKISEDAFFSKSKQHPIDDCTNIPGIPIRRLPSSPDFSSKKKKRESTFCGPQEAS